MAFRYNKLFSNARSPDPMPAGKGRLGLLTDAEYQAKREEILGEV